MFSGNSFSGIFSWAYLGKTSRQVFTFAGAA